MVNRKHVRALRIIKIVKGLLMNITHMVTAAALMLLAILSIFKWEEDPWQIHFLVMGVIALFVVASQISKMTRYGLRD